MQLKLKIAYTPTQYQIGYLESDGLGYGTGEDGTPVISARYEKLVRELSGAIDDELGRPAREAAEAEEAQRKHELDVIEAKRRARADARAAKAEQAERERQFELE